MDIELAVTTDIPQLCLLLNVLFSQESEFMPDSALQASALNAIIDGGETGDILVAKQSGQIIGMVSLLYTISTALGGRVAMLEDMVISANKRGQGVGSALITQAIAFAHQKGCKRITLLTDNDNQTAHHFYRKHGFHQSEMLVFRKLLTVNI